MNIKFCCSQNCQNCQIANIISTYDNRNPEPVYIVEPSKCMSSPILNRTIVVHPEANITDYITAMTQGIFDFINCHSFEPDIFLAMLSTLNNTEKENEYRNAKKTYSNSR